MERPAVWREIRCLVFGMRVVWDDSFEGSVLGEEFTSFVQEGYQRLLWKDTFSLLPGPFQHPPIYAPDKCKPQTKLR
jgi:hypothetical protein